MNEKKPVATKKFNFEGHFEVIFVKNIKIVKSEVLVYLLAIKCNYIVYYL